GDRPLRTRTLPALPTNLAAGDEADGEETGEHHYPDDVHVLFVPGHLTPGEAPQAGLAAAEPGNEPRHPLAILDVLLAEKLAQHRLFRRYRRAVEEHEDRRDDQEAFPPPGHEAVRYGVDEAAQVE